MIDCLKSYNLVFLRGIQMDTISKSQNTAIEMEFLDQYQDSDVSFAKKVKDAVLFDDSKKFITLYKKHSLKIRKIFNDKLEKNLIILGKIKIVNSLIKINSFQLDQPLSFYAGMIIKVRGNSKDILYFKNKFEAQINTLKILFKNGFYMYNGKYDWSLFFINQNHNLFSYNRNKHLEYIHNELNVSFENDEINNYNPICLALQYKSKSNNLVLKKMIELGANINYSNLNPHHIDFPVKTAIEYDNLEGLKILLDNDAYFSDKSSSLLELAVENHNLNMVKFIINKLPDLDINKTSCLHIACIYQYHDMIKYLLSINADPNASSLEGGELPLEISLAYHDFKTCDMLIEAGANANYKNNHGYQVIELVVKNNDFESLKYLQKNTILNFNYRHNSLFLAAIQKASVEMVSWMIEHGADVNKTYLIDKISPLSLALEKNRFEVVQILIKHGAKININSSYRPFLAAFMYADINLIKYLLNFSKIDRYSDLFQAIPLRKKEHIEAYEILISQGGNVNECGLNGEFPLDSAINSQKKNLVQYLVKKGADIYLKNKQGKSVMEHSLERGHVNFFDEIRPLINEIYNDTSLSRKENHVYYVSQPFIIK